MPLKHCADCGVEHYGRVPCGMTLMERIGTVDISPAATPTRRLRRYFDSESVDAQFGGETARERKEHMLEETNGVGFIEMGADGIPQHQDRRTGEMVQLDKKEASKLMGVNARGRDDALDA